MKTARSLLRNPPEQKNEIKSPFGNNLFLGSLKEEDADGVSDQVEVPVQLEGGRMRRSHDGFQNWVSHWLNFETHYRSV